MYLNFKQNTLLLKNDSSDIPYSILYRIHLFNLKCSCQNGLQTNQHEELLCRGPSGTVTNGVKRVSIVKVEIPSKNNNI